VTSYLESEGITIMPHPPIFPDLAPCDFWLFDLIKENLADQNDSESLRYAVTEFMYSLSKEEYKKTFDKWIQRMQLCVDNEGDYFEHLMKSTLVEFLSVFILFCIIMTFYTLKYWRG